MSNINDTKIIELKKQIEEKRKKLEGIKKFTPITNCSIEADGIRYNINVLTKELLISLVVKLHSYRLSAKDLGLLDDYFISGYKVDEWITDLKARLDVVSCKDEERKLKTLEDKLENMLSNEKKVELELSEIAELLK